MRLYAPEVEERVAVQALVREWTRSRLLDPPQLARLEQDLATDVRRTNTALRIALAVFAVLIAAASMLFVFSTLHVSTPSGEIIVSATAAVLYLGLAEMLVRRFGFYRFGVEEAFAVMGVIAFALAVSIWVDGRVLSVVAGLLSAAAGGLWIYGRFGFVYGAMASAVCVAAIPFQLDLPYATTRILAAAAFAVVCAIAHLMLRKTKSERRRAEYADLRAAAWAGLYLVLNLQLTLDEPPVGRVFYWCTYALTWVLPTTGFWVAIRDKDRALLGANLIATLITLLTHKPYLHWTRHPWDPIVFGILLVSAALGIRRWLSSGPGGARNGYTPQRLLAKEAAALHGLGTVALGLQPAGMSLGRAPHASPRTSDGFDGGQSGGGGGGASY